MIRRVLVLLIVLTASLSLSSVVRSTTATANWLQYRSDNRRSGFNPNETQITPANVGSLRLKEIVGFPFDGPTPPLVFASKLYTVGVSFVDPNQPDGSLFPPDESTVYALDPVNGSTRWSQDIACHAGRPVSVPAISTTAHTLIIPMDKYCDTQSGDGHLLGLDPATGSVKWDNSAFQSWGNPAVLGGNVFVSGSYFGDYATSIDAGTGFNNWTYGGGGRLGDVSVGGGQVYFSEEVGGVPMLTSLDPTTGALLWTKGSATGVPTLGDGRIFVDCDSGICSYNQSGTLKWSFTEGDGPIAYAKGTVYVKCDSEALCALEGKTGALLWGPTGVGDSQHHVTVITVANGVVFANVSHFGAPLSDALGFFAVNASTGEFIGSFGPGAARGTFAAGDLPNDLAVVNGHVYLINENRLYIFALP